MAVTSPEAVTSFRLQGRAASKVCKWCCTVSHPEELLGIMLSLGRLRPRWRRDLLGWCGGSTTELGLEPGSPAPLLRNFSSTGCLPVDIRLPAPLEEPCTDLSAEIPESVCCSSLKSGPGCVCVYGGVVCMCACSGSMLGRGAHLMWWLLNPAHHQLTACAGAAGPLPPACNGIGCPG